MKKTICSLLALMMLISFSLRAQVNYRITENSYQKVKISFTFGTIESAYLKTNEGAFSRIYMEGCAGSNSIGNPELPVAVNMLEIPICGDYVLNVYGKDLVIYDAQTLDVNYPVYPVQPSLSKSHEGPVEFMQNKTTYQTDAFYALPLAQFEETGIMRNLNTGTLYVSPVQYNPVTQEIKIYKTIDVEIIFKKIEFLKTQVVKELHKNPLFYPSHIINPVQHSNAEFASAPIKYLIVAHPMFRGALDEFIAWKQRKGFLVEIVYTDEENVGVTTTSIAAFIKSHYDNATSDNPAPTFVLLVGDVEQIPTFKGTEDRHPTDLYYFTWAGGNIPCCYYGRFSAQNVAQLTPQIEKTLQYEQYKMPDPNYLNNIVLIAGYDKDEAPIYGNAFVNYVTKYYANNKYGYKEVYAHYHPCNLEGDAIRDEIGKGVGIANYTAHCNEHGWSIPAFSKNQISEMNNLDKYGLIIGNCCLSSRFNIKECFGEALLRAAGKGAVGYIGASNYTYWDEDFYWSVGMKSPYDSTPIYNPQNLGAYDKLFHTHDEPFHRWMTTFGSMLVAGNEAIQMSTSSLKTYYWEIYHLMGDPSVMTYLAQPKPMNVEVAKVLKVGETTLQAKVAPNAYCALTDSIGTLLCAGFADETGNITLNLIPLVAGKYEFAAWAQNYVQFFKTIMVRQGAMNEDPCFISPNPAHTTLNIFADNLIISYEIVDMIGKRISFQKNINTNLTEVNVSSLLSGVYFIRIKDNQNKTYTKKFVKN